MDFDDYLQAFYGEEPEKPEKKVDSEFCSCYNKEVVESHVCVNRIPTEDDKFLFCRNCRKEYKK